MGVMVAVAGASGYAGGELLRLLLAHPEFGVGAMTARTVVGAPLIEHHPHLVELADRTFEPTTSDVLAGHDVVFLALPHGASAQVATLLPNDILVVDCGADHRLADAGAWQQFYGTPHGGTWPYGLPELVLSAGGKQRDSLRNARRIAVPGCNVTAVTLALAPGLAVGLLEPLDIVAIVACGTSGAGKKLEPHLLASQVIGATSPYAVGGGHRHVPEIQQTLTAASGARVSLSFIPTLVPMSRGILATVTAKLRTDVPAAHVRAAWHDAYAEEPFVQLLPEGLWPNTAAVLGANVAQVQVAVDESAGRVVAIAAIDNLTKGTAGGAIQAANIALGWPETLGLPVAGVAP
jgi:N-acetyl-gamma-glutamyl-phosphate reductase